VIEYELFMHVSFIIRLTFFCEQLSNFFDMIWNFFGLFRNFQEFFRGRLGLSGAFHQLSRGRLLVNTFLILSRARLELSGAFDHLSRGHLERFEAIGHFLRGLVKLSGSVSRTSGTM